MRRSLLSGRVAILGPMVVLWLVAQHAVQLTGALLNTPMKTHFLTDFCQQNASSAAFELEAEEDQAGWLSVTNSRSYIAGFNCTLALTAPNRSQVYLSFAMVDTRNCLYDHVRVGYGNGSVHGADLCGTIACKNETCPGLMFVSGSGTRNLTVAFASSADPTAPSSRSGFKALFTVFNTGDCSEHDHFKCKNDHCILHRLACDGHNHCMDKSDEDYKLCGWVTGQETVWGILSVVAGVLVMTIFMPLIIYLAVCGVRKKVRVSTTSFEPSTGDVNGEVDSLMSSLEQSHVLPASYGSTVWHARTFGSGSSQGYVRQDSASH